ncbi:hypothetical protein AB1Y20_019629 [Prymnesium parvum]|uniref:Centrosomal protein POC5 n=1 Tax=Prymnesium parvum TaxID=97485 RepID=A0AB34JVG0_PRYPA
MLRADYSAAETKFLRHEVANLELAIAALRSQGGAAAREASERVRREAEARLQQMCAREAEMAAELRLAREESTTLFTHARLLHHELTDTEEQGRAARAAESSALGVARSYRSFATQGARKLEELQRGMQEAQARVQARLAELHNDTRLALRRQALRAVVRWGSEGLLHRAVRQWRLAALAHSYQRVVTARLEAAYRRADAEMGGRRVQMVAQLREREELAEAAAVALQRELDDVRQQRDSAAIAAAAEAQMRRQLQAELEKLGRRAARGELVGAEQREQDAHAARATAQAQLDAASAELRALRLANAEHQQESEFLARALRDERRHRAGTEWWQWGGARCVALRAREAEQFASVADGVEELAEELEYVSSLTRELRFDVVNALCKM